MSHHVHLIAAAKDSGCLSKVIASLKTGLNTRLGMRLNRLWERVGQGHLTQPDSDAAR